MTTSVQIEPGIHAHRCENCAKQGVTTLWIHGDENAGKVEPHTCPRCGQNEWKKWLIPVGELPKARQAEHGGAAHFVQFVSLQQLHDVIYMGVIFVACCVLSAYIVFNLYNRFAKKGGRGNGMAGL